MRAGKDISDFSAQFELWILQCVVFCASVTIFHNCSKLHNLLGQAKKIKKNKSIKMSWRDLCKSLPEVTYKPIGMISVNEPKIKDLNIYLSRG
jgi:hypothetical protein